MADDLPHLSALELRVLGCLMEKQLLTPDVYPLTLNALLSAANQKTSREPVMSLDASAIASALTLLEGKGLAQRVGASRVDRYEQTSARKFSMTTSQSALVAMLMLRGPQTLNELHARTDRMANFGSVDAVREELNMLMGKRPPLVKELGRAPGQREDRFAHLLAGDIDISAIPAPAPRAAPVPAMAALEERLKALEDEVARLKARLEAIEA